MKKTLAILFLLGFIILKSFAQNSNPYEEVDNYVIGLGSMDKMDISEITNKLTGNLSDRILKCRSIYYWIANNIVLDPVSCKKPEKAMIQPEQVVRFRKTNAKGFALLVQEMCSLSGIRCLVIDGYTQTTIESIGEKPEDFNHSWNVIQLGKSPDVWYYIDAAKASGFLDEKQNNFTKLFCEDYFFTQDKTFNLDHFPDNDAWLLGESISNKKSFFNMPVVGVEAYQIGLRQIFPLTGIINAKINQPIKFQFYHKRDIDISSITVLIEGSNKKQKTERINFTDDNGKTNFEYIFNKEIEANFKLQINQNPLLSYKIIATE